MVDRQRLLGIVDALEGVTVALYGDLVLDRFILGTPKRISREAPVIILRYEEERDVPGGGANALANLAALGARVVPVAVVGADAHGRSLLGALAERGIDTSHILVVPELSTPTKVRILGGGPSSLKHQVARYDIEDVLPEQGPWRAELAVRLDAAVAGAGAVAVSDYGYGTVDQRAIRRLASDAPPPPWVCLDSRHRLLELDGAHGVTPNLQELEATTGHALERDEDVAAAAEALRGHLHARFVLATRGSRGMTLVEEGRAPLHLGVFGTDQVADVTGAGDTVLAVLTAALAVGASPEEAARLANYAGGVVVMKLGTATVRRDELREAVLLDLGSASS